MRLVDWRDRSVPPLDDEWRREADRWLSALSWDSRPACTLIESQRRSGLLPGLVLLDGRTIAGWTYFLILDDILQVGGFHARSSEAAQYLVDGIVTLAAPALAPDGVMVFCFADAAGLGEALARHRFEREHYLYLMRRCPLDGPRLDGAAAAVDDRTFEWSRGADRELPALFARAYHEPERTRPFARRGTAEQWREYVDQLVRGDACGRFDPALSAASFSSDGALDGAVLVTAVHASTAHIAQVSVDPARQGRGLAGAMIRRVLSTARARGYERVSLLVAEHNVRARRLYQQLGFDEAARFTSAGRPAYPRRSTSPAAISGGASTFR